MGHGENIHPNKPFSTFPKTIGKWIGREGRFAESTYEILGVDDSFLGNYTAPDGSQIQLYVGFHQSQREGDLIHSPKNCMPGSGWNITQTSLKELSMPNSNPGKIKVIKLLLEKSSQKQIVLYWFQSRGRFISSEYMQKIYLIIDAITRHRTDGAFVRLIAPVVNGNEDVSLKNLEDFFKLLMPILQDYIPS
jgi:EpsI family protein